MDPSNPLPLPKIRPRPKFSDNADGIPSVPAHQRTPPPPRRHKPMRSSPLASPQGSPLLTQRRPPKGKKDSLVTQSSPVATTSSSSVSRTTTRPLSGISPTTSAGGGGGDSPSLTRKAVISMVLEENEEEAEEEADGTSDLSKSGGGGGDGGMRSSSAPPIGGVGKIAHRPLSGIGGPTPRVGGGGGGSGGGVLLSQSRRRMPVISAVLEEEEEEEEVEEVTEAETAAAVAASEALEAGNIGSALDATILQRSLSSKRRKKARPLSGIVKSSTPSRPALTHGKARNIVSMVAEEEEELREEEKEEEEEEGQHQHQHQDGGNALDNEPSIGEEQHASSTPPLRADVTPITAPNTKKKTRPLSGVVKGTAVRTAPARGNRKIVSMVAEEEEPGEGEEGGEAQEQQAQENATTVGTTVAKDNGSGPEDVIPSTTKVVVETESAKAVAVNASPPSSAASSKLKKRRPLSGVVKATPTRVAPPIPTALGGRKKVFSMVAEEEEEPEEEEESRKDEGGRNSSLKQEKNPDFATLPDAGEVELVQGVEQATETGTASAAAAATDTTHLAGGVVEEGSSVADHLLDSLSEEKEEEEEEEEEGARDKVAPSASGSGFTFTSSRSTRASIALAPEGVVQAPDLELPAEVKRNSVAREPAPGAPNWNLSADQTLERYAMMLRQLAGAKRGQDELSSKEYFWGDGLYDVVENGDKEAADFAKLVAEARDNIPCEDSSNQGFLLGARSVEPLHVALQGLPCVLKVTAGVIPEKRRRNKPSVGATAKADGIPSATTPASEKKTGAAPPRPTISLDDATLGTSPSELAAKALKALQARGALRNLDFTDVIFRFKGTSAYLAPAPAPGTASEDADPASAAPLGGYIRAARAALRRQPLHLVLEVLAHLPKPFLRRALDDRKECAGHRFVRVNRILPVSISREAVRDLLLSCKREAATLLELAQRKKASSCQRVVQSTKAVCFAVVRLETQTLRAAIAAVEAALSDTGALLNALADLHLEVLRILHFYQTASNQSLLSEADTRVVRPARVSRPSSTIPGPLRVRIASLHRLPATWAGRYARFRAGFALHWGIECIAAASSQASLPSVSGGFWFGTVAWSGDFVDLGVPIRVLPRETRIVVTLSGANDPAREVTDEVGWEPLGWVAFRLYDHRGYLQDGDKLLGLWQEPEARPTGTCESDILNKAAPLLVVGCELGTSEVVYGDCEDEHKKGAVLPPDGALAAEATDDVPVPKAAAAASSEADAPQPAHPSTTLTSTTPSSATTGATGEAVLSRHLVRFSYQVTAEDELGIIEGTVVEVLEKAEGGWWRGRLANDSTEGWFPENYCCEEPLAEGEEPEHAVYIAQHTYEPEKADELALRVGTIVHALQQPEGGWWRGLDMETKSTGWFPSNFVAPQDAEASFATTGPTITPAKPPKTSNENLSNVADNDTKNEVALGSKESTPTDPAMSETESADKSAVKSSPEPRSGVARNEDEKSSETKQPPTYVTVHAFEPTHEDELKLKIGDMVSVLDRPEGGWWRGRVNLKSGWFPANHVCLPSDAAKEPEIETETESKAIGAATKKTEEALPQQESIATSSECADPQPAAATAADAAATDAVAAAAADAASSSAAVDEAAAVSTAILAPSKVGEGLNAAPSARDDGTVPTAVAEEPVEEPSNESNQQDTSEENTGVSRDSFAPSTALRFPTHRAIHEYAPTMTDELTLTPGDMITVLEQPEGGWWRGRVGLRSGWFPAPYAEALPEQVEMGFEKAAMATDTLKYVATQIFEPTSAEELRLTLGDIVTVLQKKEGGWWLGKQGERKGWFPSDHVRESVQPPSGEMGQRRTTASQLVRASVADAATAASKAAQAAAASTEALPQQLATEVETLVAGPATLELSDSERKFVWMVRAHLTSDPRALPRVVAAMPALRSPRAVADAARMVLAWAKPDIVGSLALLHQHTPDTSAREAAVNWLAPLSDGALIHWAPQLVHALKYETLHGSALALMLMRRAMRSPRLTHALFWLFSAELSSPAYGRRFEVLLEGLLNTCGSKMRQELAWQAALVASMGAATNVVLSTPGSASAQRDAVLSHLRALDAQMPDCLRLPIGPEIEVTGLDAESCSVFSSARRPLMLSFRRKDGASPSRGNAVTSPSLLSPSVCVIYKQGDDLRQDAAILQLIDVMADLWRGAGLDMCVPTYRCTPTGAREGLIEVVPGAKTLRQIQTRTQGATGALNDRHLYAWLRDANPTEEAWALASKRFRGSCAAYCVATYVLGIGDRHNDNIMVTPEGMLFHIDYGRILGNVQKLGPVKRDRVPFVLTGDMAYVINEGDKPTPAFQDFIDLCCGAFRVLRTHTTLLDNLLGLMLNAGLPGLRTAEDAGYLRRSLLPDVDDAAAILNFTRSVQKSLAARSTKINNFVHSLVHRNSRLSSTGEEGASCLSFATAEGSVAVDGMVRRVTVSDFEKRYDTEGNKYYVYVIEVTREGGAVQIIFRRYSEFNELNSKLPVFAVRLPSFPGKKFVTRSHIGAVSERRRRALNEYMQQLLLLPATVSESTLLYTFLRPMNRDTRDVEDRTRRAEVSRRVSLGASESSDSNGGDKMGPSFGEDIVGAAGEIQLAVAHDTEMQRLAVSVTHCRNLRGNSRNPYVKIYLQPDPNKETKRKTSVKTGTLHPTFNETLTWDTFDPSLLSKRYLEVAVMDRDRFGENAFLGGMRLPLDQEGLLGAAPAWYALAGTRATNGGSNVSEA